MVKTIDFDKINDFAGVAIVALQSLKETVPVFQDLEGLNKKLDAILQTVTSVETKVEKMETNMEDIKQELTNKISSMETKMEQVKQELASSIESIEVNSIIRSRNTLCLRDESIIKWIKVSKYYYQLIFFKIYLIEFSLIG